MLISPQLHKEIEAIKEDIKEEYRQPHSKEWIVGFSGGKDSTLMLHLVVESILEIPWSQRTRPIHIVANDTLVESPIVQGYVNKILKQIEQSLKDLDLPFIVQKTFPATEQTFWVNLIGRGYPAPTRMFRWCTDRLKIRPTTNYIREKIGNDGEVILLLGVRRSESSARAKSASRYDNGGRLNRHNDIQGCWVYRPILELNTEDIWEFVLGMDSPWGDSHNELVRLYKDAAGGECPLVIDPDSAPSCGSSSIRFGCWTCTVVKKDKSFRNAMEKEQYAALEPMADFRDWLLEFCYSPENRLPMRRNGQDGPGPLTFEARELVLNRLLQLQKIVGEDLITEAEIKTIEKIWLEDKSQHAIHQANRLLNMMENI